MSNAKLNNVAFDIIGFFTVEDNAFLKPVGLCILLLQYNVFTGCTQGALRLQGGASDSINIQGRVEICNNNIWGTVCGTLWNTINAQVVCRQLGFSTTGIKLCVIIHKHS